MYAFRQVKIMFNTPGMIILGMSVWLLLITGTAQGKQATDRQIKGLDEQVQEIKSDVLAISAELNELEEKLLYPSHTQISIFLALADGEQLRLDSVDIKLDGKSVTHHLYTFKELEALRMGGVQRIYTGNVKVGEHSVEVTYRGQSREGKELHKSQTFSVSKDERPGIFNITLAQQAISVQDW
ncbi:MAG: hypothetical protein C0619_15855 [Desulfuromonas sp.]|nr:MAG: hypothetical protein C0619_15855 [Desulfuromonas sp.]